MINKLITILNKEDEALKVLLEILERQHTEIVNKNAFALDEIVDEIRTANRSIAECEVARRKLLGGESVKKIINDSKNKELDCIYRNTKKTINEVKLQNETNDFLIKQQLSYTNRILSIINPRREAQIYNSYGKV